MWSFVIDLMSSGSLQWLLGDDHRAADLGDSFGNHTPILNRAVMMIVDASGDYTSLLCLPINSLSKYQVSWICWKWSVKVDGGPRLVALGPQCWPPRRSVKLTNEYSRRSLPCSTSWVGCAGRHGCRGLRRTNILSTVQTHKHTKQSTRESSI